MCHLVYFFKLQDGFDDTWYADTRMRRELETRGVDQVRSWRTLVAAREDVNPVPPNDYDRMTEVRFGTLKDAEAALCRKDSPWAASHHEGLDRFEGIVVGPRPEYNLLADVPPQQYPFMGMPIVWRTGKPPDIPAPQTASLARYMYFFRYRDDVDIRLGEEWYLGHHTREGKQLPGIQTYITWKRRPIPGLEDFIPEVARLYRYTEIGYETIEYQQLAVNLEAPRWVPTMHYRQGVWDFPAYRNFYIPEDPDIVVVKT
jgi:hypothetical protein